MLHLLSSDRLMVELTYGGLTETSRLEYISELRWRAEHAQADPMLGVAVDHFCGLEPDSALLAQLETRIVEAWQRQYGPNGTVAVG